MPLRKNTSLSEFAGKVKDIVQTALHLGRAAKLKPIGGGLKGVKCIVISPHLGKISPAIKTETGKALLIVQRILEFFKQCLKPKKIPIQFWSPRIRELRNFIYGAVVGGT